MAAIELDFSRLDGLANKLAGMTGAELQGATIEAVNAVAVRTAPTLRASIIATINLTDAYVRRKTNMQLAQPGRPVATLSAPFPSKENPPTSLGRYGAQVVQQAAKSPLRKLKGNPGLGIPKGMKPMAVSVEVNRGGRKVIGRDDMAMLPTLHNSDGDPLVLQVLPGKSAKTKKAKLRSRFGPSVYQLYRVAIATHLDEIASDLELELLAEVDDFLEREGLT